VDVIQLQLISPSSQIQSAEPEDEVAIEGEELGSRTSVTHSHVESEEDELGF